MLRLIRYNEFNPEKYKNIFRMMFGEEKFKDLEKMISSGLFCNPFLLITSMYLNDKANFLLGPKFINNL